MSEAPPSRRVLIRVIGAPLLLAAVAGIVYVDYALEKPLAVTGLLGVFAVASYRELCAMARIRGMRPASGLGTLALAAIFVSILWAFHEGASPMGRAPAAIALGWLLLLMVLLVFRYAKFTPFDAAYSFLGVAYVGLLAFVVLPPAGGTLYLVFLVATNKGSDMAAYSAGKLIGRHKLAPVVSPNKTWEGAIGGLIVGAGLGALVLTATSLREAVHHAPIWAIGAYAAAVTVSAQLGDLVKSAFKRWAGVKDSGRLLPEFGGALDMCDSFVLSAPVAWVGLSLF